MESALGAVIARLPAAPGVYRFRDGRGRALYIGRATVLRQRVGSYWGELRDRRHLRRMVPQVARIEAVACDSVHEAGWLERNLLEQAKPRWNRIRGGAEVPVYIRLDRTARTPRLTVEHWPVTPGRGDDFGPYLGGSQARLAVSALDRVLPLRYTDDRLAGGLKDLARIRGIDYSDRERLSSTITGVLQRRPADIETVRSHLVHLLDRASENLVFELAARLQAELEALAWIVAEQKVTELVPAADGEVHGWDDGLLVTFHLRGGRLCGWGQRRCSRAAALPYLERTPAAWSAFAARAAELGGRLDDVRK
jgi:excinuclease ABC subunit C